MRYFQDKQKPPPYPVANQISTRYRAAATRQRITDGMSLWAGQGASGARPGGAKEILTRLWDEARRLCESQD
jgi:NAD(P)H-dependent flavin oxidoreductase YrpB (nitropropane dioxygenase family)